MRIQHNTHMSEICDVTTAGIRGHYAEISYPKPACGFLNARKPTAAFKGWREEVKAYIMVLEWNPTILTATQMDSVLSFAGSLMPVKARMKLLKQTSAPKTCMKLNLK